MEVSCNTRACNHRTYRRLPIGPFMVQFPFEAPSQLEQGYSHLQHSKIFPQASSLPAVERYELSTCPGSPIAPPNFLHGRTPAIGIKLVCGLPPDAAVAVGGVAIVPYISTLGHVDSITQQNVCRNLSIEELGNGREETQTFIDDGGEVG